MKKTILLGILSLATAATTSFGQGYIQLDNYNSHGGNGGPLVTYGPNSGGTLGAGINSSFTVGLYFADGNVLGSISDPSAGNGNIDAALALGSGTGSTVAVQSTAFGNAGEFAAANAFNAGGAAGDTLTVEIVAYLTSAGSYANSTLNRGHSAAFTMTDAAINILPKPLVGDFMSGFSVSPVPEPSIFALAGMGAAALMAFRRKK
jgi:hypothetical protein